MKKKNPDFDIRILNVVNEFTNYKKNLKKNKVKIINFKNTLISKILSDKGFLISRMSFVIMFLFSFMKLKKELDRNKPDFLIIHLLTSLPLILFLFFKFDTKIILRISGLPKLNFLRKLLWISVAKKISLITCPTQKTCKIIKDLQIISKNKIKLLRDPVIDRFKNYSRRKKFIFSAGRLTRQKNFEHLLYQFKEISKKDNNVKLIIAGDGEEKDKLNNIIKNLKINNKVRLIGYKKNITKYFSQASVFISSSLWEDPGFVLIEAMSYGTFVISSDVPNIKGDVIKNNFNGFLYDINIKNDLCKKYFKYLNLTKYEKKFYSKNGLLTCKKYSTRAHGVNFLKIISNI